MGFIFSAHKIVNDIEKMKLEKKIKSPELKSSTSNTIIEELSPKLSPKIKKRVKSIDNFMKFQWSWTL